WNTFSELCNPRWWVRPEQALVPADTFDEHGAGEHRDTVAGNLHCSIGELLAQPERRVSDDPIKRPLSVFGFQKIGNSTKGIVEHVKRRYLAEVRSKSHRHVPSAAGGLKAGHRAEEVLGVDDMLY